MAIESFSDLVEFAEELDDDINTNRIYDCPYGIPYKVKTAAVYSAKIIVFGIFYNACNADTRGLVIVSWVDEGLILYKKGEITGEVTVDNYGDIIEELDGEYISPEYRYWWDDIIRRRIDSCFTDFLSTHLIDDTEPEDEPDTDDDDDDWDDDDDDCLTFARNADKSVAEQLHQKSTTAYYEALRESMENSYETIFATNFQTYVTRLGLIIHTVASKKFYGATKNKSNNYAEILQYICHDILDDDFLYAKLKKLNKFANDAKHSTKNIDIDINSFVAHFNVMIDKLVSVSGCKAFEICHLYTGHRTGKQIICDCCGLVNLTQYHRCPECRKYVCVDCFDRKRRMCANCKTAPTEKPQEPKSRFVGMVPIPIIDDEPDDPPQFYMCDHTVTQAEYERVMGENPSKHIGENLPVTNVTLYDAIAYCNKLSKREGLTPFYVLDGLEISCDTSANGYRLPNSYEWHSVTIDFRVKESLEDFEDYGWFKQNGGSAGLMEVGLKKANKYGLYDLLGNVSEWCYDYGYYGLYDYVFDFGGSVYEMRRGRWLMLGGNKDPWRGYNRVGFRLARNAD